MSFEMLSTSSRDFASLTPPPFPLPPAWTCALTTNNQATRFEGLELSNHEVVHQKELPGFNPGLDSLVNTHEAYSFSIETEGEQSKKSSSETVKRGKDS